MTETLQFVVRHGYFLLFAWVFVEQAGLPLPSAPLLLAAGAVSGMHHMNLGAKAFACSNCSAGFLSSPIPACEERK
jgi:membrane protein DedA with SNARE-associated domain